jgi:hypothetical protein
MKKADETRKREWWKSGNVKMKIEVMLLKQEKVRGRH